jgi:nucleoside-diphosphate-sugar epimerase
MKKILITGIDSFTGKYLSNYLKNFNYDIYGTSLHREEEKIYKCDITNFSDLERVIINIKPNYIIHLAAISFVGYKNYENFYKINTIGSINLLETLIENNILPEKIILASSAVVYGNQKIEILSEELCPNPTNHYGCSKLAMEHLAKNYFDKLPIIITRPFNYTGIGQKEYFLIPKIIKHFKDKKSFIELGNLDVVREFNDVNFVCEVYKRLLESEIKSEIVNICSGRGIKLLDIINMMEKIAGFKIKIKINPKFVRKNEIKKLIGSNKKLFSLIGRIEPKNFEEVLKEMYYD